jgi:HPt (histidine-containing phosphotransfer) domain-containing protein
VGAQRALPEEVAQSLRQAFASERDSRLPAQRLMLGTAGDPEAALHAAHALASSAWVIGEREISTLARSVEEALEAGTEPVDLAALVAALERWVP